MSTATADTGEMTVFYAIYDDGSISRVENLSGEEPQLLKPGRYVSAEEYQAAYDAISAKREEYVAELRAADEARTKGDYDALIAAGIPDATARRLSGYEGE